MIFNDQCYRLVGSEIIQSTVPGVLVGTIDQLFFPSTDTANNNIIEIEYRWLVLCNPGAESPTYPWAEITSGTQYKYNGGGYGASDLPIPEPAENQISITKSADPLLLIDGGSVAYTVTLTNIFSQPLYVNKVTDLLPSGVTFTGETLTSEIDDGNSAVSPADGSTGEIDWYGIPSPTASKSYLIPAGGSITLIYTADIQDVNGDYTNSVTAEVGNTTIGPVTTTVTVEDANPELTLVKSITSGDPYAAVNDVINYSFLVTNTGNVSLAGPVTINDDQATDESCPAVTTVGNLDGNLDPGESITCTASYTVDQDDLNAGSVVNIADASADGTTSATDTETADATEDPELTLVKSITSGDPYAAVNDVINYSFLVTNTGNVSLAGPVTINDDQATDESCPAVTTVGNLDGNLDPGESITCTASYTVDQDDLNAGSVVNIADASADGTTSAHGHGDGGCDGEPGTDVGEEYYERGSLRGGE